MLRTYKLVSVAIVLFWLVMMGFLVNREVLVERAAPSTVAAAPYDTWMGIYTRDEWGEEESIGYLHTVSERETRDGVEGSQYTVAFNLAANMLSMPVELQMNGSAWIADGKGLSEFDFDVSTGNKHAMSATGVVGDGVLSVLVSTAGSEFPFEIPLRSDVLVSGNMGTASFNFPALEIGEKLLIDTFDPLTFSSGTARIECVGMETLLVTGEMVATKKLTTTLGGVTSTSWVTENGEVVRVETPFGLILKKITEAEALQVAKSPASGASLLDGISIVPSGKTPFRGARRMRVRLSGYPDIAEPPSDVLQRRLDFGLYEIRASDFAADGVEAPAEPYLGDYLLGDAFVQVDHPRIVSQAQKIVGDIVEPLERAKRLHHWIYENIDKIIVLSFPSALDVLESREGDCNEHTVLFAALARTLDIPTRIAIGVVWSDELEGFYYHAWPEVYVDGWIAMDPTLGQEIADATHIKLLTGSIEAWPRLVSYLGQLQVNVLEIE
ncbi:MAG: transglutaminase domain-containing protein [Candidatus Hydrogenedentes bacterium]|nr:transglutaminase domain-containing protein [Candidatus Hydrogenedentota bacterium]